MLRTPKRSAARHAVMLGVAALLSVTLLETIATSAHRSPAEHWTQKSLLEARATAHARADQARLAAAVQLVAQAAP